MAITIKINGSDFSVPQTGDQSWGDYTTTTLQALGANSLRDNSRVIWVNSAWGNDGNTGFSPTKSLATLNQAVIIAGSITPTSTSPVVITTQESVISVVGSVVLPDYVSLVCPQARVVIGGVSSLTLGSGARLIVSEIFRSDSGNLVNSGGDQNFIKVNRLINGSGGRGVNVQSATMVHVEVDYISAKLGLGGLFFFQDNPSSKIFANVGFADGGATWRLVDQAAGEMYLFAHQRAGFGLPDVKVGTYREFITSVNGFP